MRTTWPNLYPTFTAYDVPTRRWLSSELGYHTSLWILIGVLWTAATIHDPKRQQGSSASTLASPTISIPKSEGRNEFKIRFVPKTSESKT